MKSLKGIVLMKLFGFGLIFLLVSASAFKTKKPNKETMMAEITESPQTCSCEVKSKTKASGKQLKGCQEFRFEPLLALQNYPNFYNFRVIHLTSKSNYLQPAKIDDETDRLKTFGFDATIKRMQLSIWVLIFTMLTIQWAILINNWLYWCSRHLPKNEATVSLSVLIPARNERENLPELLETLAPQLKDGMECWVCDDESEDGTEEWLARNANRLGIQWFRSAPRPEGWVGKNWACHQLAARAQGEWLVFLDADVRCSKGFINELCAYLNATDAHLVTAIPSLSYKSLSVALLKLMVPFSVFTLLPLKFAETHPHPAFAMANGQLLAIRKRDYLRWQPHFSVRANVLEDLMIAALVKRHHGIVRILDGREWLRVLMYPTLKAAIDGFSKNAVAVCRTVPMAITVSAMMAMLYLFPLVAWVVLPEARLQATLAVLASIPMFGISARVVGTPFWLGLGYPIAVILAIITLMRSIVWYKRGKIVWKGRVYQKGL